MKNEDFDHIISQPLVTEDGFVNPACINELNDAIANMPKTYQRLNNDNEWSVPRWTSYRHIIGAFAYWSVRQIDNTNPPYPPNLEKMIGYLHACIYKNFDKFGFAELSLCNINKMLHDILMEIPEFVEWNKKEIIGEGWMDLDALLHNVCLTIRDERRINDEFDRKFDEEWEKEHGEKPFKK